MISPHQRLSEVSDRRRTRDVRIPFDSYQDVGLSPALAAVGQANSPFRVLFQEPVKEDFRPGIRFVSVRRGV